MISAAKANKGPKACATCAKAKARCIPGPVDNVCERCHRLHKSCSSQTPAPPRKRKEPKPTKVAELERRLEHLTSRLDSVARGPQQPSPPESSPDQEAAAVQTPTNHYKNKANWTSYAPFGHLFPSEPPITEHPDSMQSHPPPNNCVDHLFQSNAMERPSTVPSAGMDDVLTNQARDQSWPQPEEAEEMLQVFRDISQLFPFVKVPTSVTAEQLRRTQPFLWKGAMVVACHLDGARQSMLGKRLMQEITEAAFTKPHKSLDLLQGLELLLAHFHFDMNSFQTTNMLFLARSLAAALGLGGLQPNGAVKHDEHTPQALEQMRAYCGVYYLVTMVFTISKQADSLMSSQHLDACIQILEARAEYPSDAVLVSLVRIQQLAQSISVMFGLRGSGGGELPVAIIVKTFQQQLESYRALLPAHLKHHGAVVGHQHVAEILLYEVALQAVDAPGPFLNPSERLEMLWACLNATKGYMANRFSQPISLKPQTVCIQSFNYVYAFLTSLKLITFQFPGWDSRHVRRELNFDELLDRQIQDMLVLAERRRFKTSSGGASVVGAAGARIDPFETLAKRMTLLKASVLAELDSVTTPTATTSTVTTPSGEISSSFNMTQEIIHDLDNWPDLFADAALTSGGTEPCDGMVHPPPFMDYWSSAI